MRQLREMLPIAAPRVDRGLLQLCTKSLWTMHITGLCTPWWTRWTHSYVTHVDWLKTSQKAKRWHNVQSGHLALEKVCVSSTLWHPQLALEPMHEIFVYCQSMIILMSIIVTSVTTLQILEQIYISLVPSPSPQLSLLAVRIMLFVLQATVTAVKD